MATLNDLQKELDEDLILDHAKLEYESGRNPTLYGKWLNKYSNYKKAIIKLENDKKTALKERLDYYTGRGDEVCMTSYERSEMKTVLTADSTIMEIDTRIQLYNVMLEYCSSAMDIIKSRGFAIKNAIEIRKFEAGE